MIKHTVAFTLKQEISESEETDFFTAAKSLTAIPGVTNFQSLKQLGTSKEFDFALSMEFENDIIYQQYNVNPQHTAFVQNYWLKYVDKFWEADFEVL